MNSIGAAGAGCDSADPCHADELVYLEMDCDPNGPDKLRIRGTECGAGALTYSLLRVAAMCFDPGEPSQARFTDVHGFDYTGQWQDFTSLVGGNCDNFLAAAHWIRNGREVQAQCASRESPNLVPDCVPASEEEAADITDRLLLYTAISPKSGGNSCYPGGTTDFSRMELRSSSLDLSYQGVLSGRYMCLASSAPNYAACDDPVAGSHGPPGCDGGQCGWISGFNLAPQSYIETEVNVLDTFDLCCDCDSTEDDDCAGSPHMSALDVQCNSAAIFAICRPGGVFACDEPGALFEPLDRVVWKGPVADIDPGDSTEAPGSLSNACFQYSFANTLQASERRTDLSFAFGPAVPPLPQDDGCSEMGTLFRDDDFDGIYDACDQVVENVGPADGFHKVELRRRVRNEGFEQPFVDGGLNPDRIVLETGQEAEILLFDPEKLTVAVPPFTAFSPQKICRNVCATPQEAFRGEFSQPFVPRWYGYVADGTPDGFLAFDTVSGTTFEKVVDGNTSPTNAYVNLNCQNDDILAVSSPVDFAFRSEPLAPPWSGYADREVYIVADTEEAWPQGEASRLFGYDVQTHRSLDSDGVLLPDRERALDVAPDAGGTDRAYIARADGAFNGGLTIVDVDPASAERWSLDDSGPLYPGVPLAIEVISAGGAVTAYVTSVECSPGGGLSCSPAPPPPGGAGPQGMGPGFECKIGEGCGGGGGNWRRVMVSKIDVTDPQAVVKLWCTETYSSSAGCDSSTAYPNAGMAVDEAGTTLFLTNPGNGLLEVLDLATGTFEPPIPVGAGPVDVAVVRKGGAAGPERAYVLNRLDRTITDVDLATGLLVTFSMAKDGLPDPTLDPVAIAARSDGLRLYTADTTHSTISVIDIKPGSGTENQWVGRMLTGEDPRRLIVLRMP